MTFIYMNNLSYGRLLHRELVFHGGAGSALAQLWLFQKISRSVFFITVSVSFCAYMVYIQNMHESVYMNLLHTHTPTRPSNAAWLE